MSTIHLTMEEYVSGPQAKKGRNAKRRWLGVSVAAAGPAVCGAYAGYPVVGAIWGGTVLACAGLLRLGVAFTDRHLATRYRMNPFAHEGYTIELRRDGYIVRYGNNELQLALLELEAVFDLGDVVRLDHWSGCSTKLPKRCLSPEELEIITYYGETVEERTATRGRL